MRRINNMQSEIIALLEIMNYMDNNIEMLNKCNISTNKYRGNKSDDNKQRLIKLICMCK